MNGVWMNSEALAAVSLLFAAFKTSDVLDRAESAACLIGFIVAVDGLRNTYNQAPVYGGVALFICQVL